jgi:pilus assembly protein Flp/PilA
MGAGKRIRSSTVKENSLMDLVSRITDILVANLYVFLVCWFWLRVFGRKPYQKRQAAVAAQRGQGLVEYALILVLVAVVVIGVLLVMGPTIKELF